MDYIKTSRGWTPLHKRHHELARSWRAKGWDVEAKVEALSPSDYWVSEHIDEYWKVATQLLYSARQRANKLSIKFDIGLADIDIPKVCPLRRVPFKVGQGKHTDNSPTLDRKDPRLGYIKGNVWVISYKANRLKGNFTPLELRTFCENLLELDWVTCTSDEHAEIEERRAKWRQQLNEEMKPRWWSLYGNPTSPDSGAGQPKA